MLHDEYTDVKEQYGHDTLFFHRVDLHQGLLELAVQPEAELKGTPVTIRSGEEVQRVNCEDGTLTLASSEHIQKDLLVIADGAHVGFCDRLELR